MTLYVTDLDGTLLSSEQKISDFTQATINSQVEQGMLFTYATARSYISASKITSGLNIRLPVATYNGAFLVDHSSGKILDSCFLERAAIEPILEAIEMKLIYPLVFAFVNGLERVSWITGKENSGLCNYLKSRKGDVRLRPVHSYAELFEGDLFYITIIGGREGIEALGSIFSENIHMSCHMQEDIYTGDYLLEAFRHDATKEQAVLKLKKLSGADKIISFGDNINDMPMFRCSDECYAVENAKDDLKQIASGMIESNDDDGVAKWFKKNIFV